MIVNPQESKCRMMKLREKKSMKKSTKKQSTSKTKWGYQKLQVGSYRQDNPIEGKAGKKSLILKRIKFWRTIKKG